MAIFGDWFNELGSVATFVPNPQDARQIGGNYHTNVGRAQQKTYPLVGRCDAAGLADQVLSWVVVWDPPDPVPPSEPPRKPSVTSWVGQYHIIQGMEFITATWLLTRMTDAADDWESTMVSMDFFFRARPTSQMITLAKQFGKVASHFSPPIEQPKG